MEILISILVPIIAISLVIAVLGCAIALIRFMIGPFLGEDFDPFRNWRW